MATVEIFPGHRDTSISKLSSGLVVTSELVRIVDGWAAHRFTGDVAELEILLHRFNGDRGLDDYAELLGLIRE